jgi:mannose-6-phosphate isomerase-like protein (cupin superfamily)
VSNFPEAFVRQARLTRWYSPPGHPGALSKLLVGPDQGVGTIDFRLSLYPPSGRVDEHTHDTAEHVYYIIRGSAVVMIGDQRHLVTEDDALYIPPQVSHSIENTGLEDLFMVVIALPPDIPR